MKRVLYSAIGALLLVGGAAVAADHDGAAEPQFLNPPGAPAGLPFSDAVRVGNILFLAGKLGNVAGKSELVAGGIQGETHQTMKHIRAAVERYGSSMDKVVKCTVFLADMAEWSAMNEVYRTYFPGGMPARSAVGVNGLALGARVEIECIATI